MEKHSIPAEINREKGENQMQTLADLLILSAFTLPPILIGIILYSIGEKTGVLDKLVSLIWGDNDDM